MLFEEQISRKPDLYPWTEEYIHALWNSHWTPSDFDFVSDKKDFYVKLTPEQRIMMTRCVSAIGQIEVAVKTFWAKLGFNFPHPSLVDLGFVMANNEVIHNKAYEKLLEVLGLEDEFEKNLKEDVVAGRVNYLRKYNKKTYEDEKKQYIYAIILFTLFVENVSLFSQFLLISYFNRFHDVLKDTAQQVEYTRIEEQLHADVGIKLINTLRKEYPELFDDELVQRVKHEAAEALAAETKVIKWIMSGYEENNEEKGSRLNEEIVVAYITDRINDSMKAIGFDVKFDVDESLLEHTAWMDEESSASGNYDFFHKTAVDYAVSTSSFNDSIFDPEVYEKFMGEPL